MADEPVPVLVGDSEVNRYARRLETERDRLRDALADVKADLAGAMERLEWWEAALNDSVEKEIAGQTEMGGMNG